MRIRHLLFCFTFLLFSKLTQAQWVKPADPVLLQRLKKYAADNHLPTPGIYVYWDSIAKKPVRFNTKDFTVEELSKPRSSKAPTSTNSHVLRDAVNFHLVKDINTLTDANPANASAFGLTSSYAVINNVSYFRADDGIHGNELWRSDGTAAGTYMVKDIIPGTSGSWPTEIIVSNHNLYFQAYTNTSPSSTLWKSDGTEAGTVEVADFVGSWLFEPSYLCGVDSEVYFTATHSRFNDQLWKTDGTQEGTVLIKDFSTEDGGNNLRSFVSAGGLLYFVANTTSKGDELWRSDGTDEGTFMLKDINPDNYAYDGPNHLTSYNNHLYFSENDKDNFIKLWQTDGTPEGTVLAEGYDSSIHLVDNYSGSYTNIPFVISNNNLYFSASATITGEELYKYNPALGAVLIKDLTPGTDGAVYNSDQITDVNGTVYFISGGTRLYKTDGTADATILLKEFTNFTWITHMTNGNGRLYFVKENETYSYEPWTSDGTPEGTVLLKDIYAATEDGQKTSFTACNGKVLFSATDTVHGNELWTTDGSTTQLLTDINVTTTANSSPYQITAFKKGVIMTASTFSKGQEPWVSDGLDAKLVKDFSPGRTPSYAGNYQAKDGFAYFMATPSLNNYVSTYNVYKTDGTEAGTSQVTSITLNPLMNLFDFTITDNGTIFYVVYNYSTASNEIWKTDGTEAGTAVIKSGFGIDQFYIDRKGNYTVNKSLVAVGNTVYFKTFDIDRNVGRELWRTDGTPEGTYVVKHNNPLNDGNLQISVITAFKNQIYFDAFDGTTTALWKSDGTTSGTIKLADVMPSEFSLSNNTLFFTGATDSTGTELWKTDGTVEGTVQVSDIYSGTNSSTPASLTDVNGTLFFHASDAEHGDELWKSNGTKAGTQLVLDITPGASSSFYSYGDFYFTAAAGKLFFINYSSIWVSDGTTEGTGFIMDNSLDGVQPYSLTSSGNQLFLVGSNYKYGTELYAGNANQVVVLPVSIQSFSASLGGTDVIAKWQTSSEINTAYFNVKRSTDGIHFTNAGKVNANGISNTLQSYIFTDANVANLVSAKKVYYRLETVDKDGTVSLSKVVAVDLNWKGLSMIVHPNPVKNVLKVRLNNYSGNAVVDVYDMNGKKVRTIQQSVQNGSDITLDVSALQAGIYMIKLNLAGKILQQKFVKE